MQREPLIFEKSVPGKTAFDIDLKKEDLHRIDKRFLRKRKAEIPELSEPDVVRHFNFLSKLNYCVDDGFYPLGSCTMKYNPKINEKMASLGGFLNIHPYQDAGQIQGALKLMSDLEEMLCSITGMDAFTLQPAAGAHGESTGLLIVRAYHEYKGNTQKNKILIPDSAHGTNPASAHVTGYDAVTVRSGRNGLVDMDHLRSLMDDNVAGFMLTNPNTLGLFETQIAEISELMHSVDALLYYDGANANAILGITRPGDMGFDIVHLNLHKTFSTPHGGGGPGSGPVGVKKKLEKFLPDPRIVKKERYEIVGNHEYSIGKVRSFFGNFGVLVRAYAYILAMGKEGLRDVSINAVLNANYMKKKLGELFDVPYYDSHAMHEFVISAKDLKNRYGVTALDIAKAIIEKGFHPPTIYFPLIVSEALMIEPTESEDIRTIDRFIDAMAEILGEIKSDPGKLKGYPTKTYVRRLDDTMAARDPVLRYVK
jgi:glycine dehydrogenase subunit 2